MASRGPLEPWSPEKYRKKRRAKRRSLGTTVGSSIAMWRNGVLLPILPAFYGLLPLITGVVDQKTRGGRFHLEGWPARSFGLMWIAVAAAIHVHFYWKADPDLQQHSGIAMAVASLVFLASAAGWMLWR